MNVYDCLRNLLTFIEENNVTDEAADDGDGYTDTWHSTQFARLIQEAKEMLENSKHLPSGG